MKTRSVTAIMAKMALVILLFSMSFSCQKDIAKENNAQAGSSGAGSSIESNATRPPYNLDVSFSGGGKGVGILKFRQNKDASKIINLSTWVVNLKPNHPYLLQRAVDSIQVGACLSTTWLTLGEGLQPKSILTDGNGNGNAKLWRDVTAIPSGTEFNIHFQVVDSLTSAVVLTSDCYQYTVR